jgi:ubiquinone/menaquinone biosynthesis C-methylase UbiE
MRGTEQLPQPSAPANKFAAMGLRPQNPPTRVRTNLVRAGGLGGRRPIGAVLTASLRRLLCRPTSPTQLDVWEGYARWAATYEQDMEGHPLALAESAAMRALLPECGGLVALDAACGTGRYARLLAERGARQVIGIDQSAEMLERARAGSPALAGWKTGGTPPSRGQAARATSVSFTEGDLLALPLADASCDVAVVALALAHLETGQLKQSFAELRRVLRPGGVLLMSEMHPFGALTGGRCRFEQGQGAGRQVYHIQTHTHLHEDYFAAADAAGFALETLREPRLTPDLYQAFERAGMGSFARQFTGFPLALVCRWRVAEER